MSNPKHYSFVTGFDRKEYAEYGAVCCSTIMGDNGLAVAVFTRWDKDAHRYRSDFFWLWLRINGLTSTWMIGDPVVNEDGFPWIRWEGKSTDTESVEGSRLHYIHGDAVATMRTLYDEGYATNPTYGGAAMSPLWGDHKVQSVMASYISSNSQTSHATK